MTDDHYLLGHADVEWRRLADQHAVWRDTLLPTLREHGLRPGARVLEVGCGTGELLEDLLAVAGTAVGLERDPRAARATTARFEGRPVDIHEGDLHAWEPEHAFDLIVARWVFCFLSEPAAAVERLASWLAPGGSLVIQDYDHDGLKVFPERPAIARTVDGFRAAWKAEGFDLWVAPKLSGYLQSAGLGDVALSPHVRAGAPGSPPWRWVEDFLFGHIGTVVEGGHLSAGEDAQFRRAWAEAAAEPASVLVSPIQLTVAARAPTPPDGAGAPPGTG